MPIIVAPAVQKDKSKKKGTKRTDSKEETKTQHVEECISCRVEIEAMQWGMIIPNSNDLVINGRLEELVSKPFFKGLLERKRCVITFNGYYEWNEQNKKAFLFKPKGGKPCLTPKETPSKAAIE